LAVLADAEMKGADCDACCAGTASTTACLAAAVALTHVTAPPPHPGCATCARGHHSHARIPELCDRRGGLPTHRRLLLVPASSLRRPARRGLCSAAAQARVAAGRPPQLPLQELRRRPPPQQVGLQSTQNRCQKTLTRSFVHDAYIQPRNRPSTPPKDTLLSCSYPQPQTPELTAASLRTHATWSHKPHAHHMHATHPHHTHTPHAHTTSSRTHTPCCRSSRPLAPCPHPHGWHRWAQRQHAAAAAAPGSATAQHAHSTYCQTRASRHTHVAGSALSSGTKREQAPCYPALPCLATALIGVGGRSLGMHGPR
jgi:hypothetical protein